MGPNRISKRFASCILMLVLIGIRYVYLERLWLFFLSNWIHISKYIWSYTISHSYQIIFTTAAHKQTIIIDTISNACSKHHRPPTLSKARKTPHAQPKFQFLHKSVPVTPASPSPGTTHVQHLQMSRKGIPAHSGAVVGAKVAKFEALL